MKDMGDASVILDTQADSVSWWNNIVTVSLYREIYTLRSMVIQIV